MSSKRKASESSDSAKKRPRKAITMEEKLEVIRRYDRGESTNAIRGAMNFPESTLRTIRKDREKILGAVKAGASSLSTKLSGQSDIMRRLEKMVYTWMSHRKHQGLSATYDDTKRKALEVYEHLKNKEEDKSSVPDFTASTGWFYKFKSRFGFHNVKKAGEAKSADEEAAASYPLKLKEIIEEGGYRPKQVFNMDETGLQWKKMPERTYIAKEEKVAPGFKAFKDRFTLLFGANLTGDCKLKPVMVYHSENPRALKGYNKKTLPVHWYSNKSAWMTANIFNDYSMGPLVAELKEYCMANNLPFRILMVLDNAPAHPQVLQDLHNEIKFVFLPPNTTALIQPMDQGVIQMFKTHYLQRTWRSLSSKCDMSLSDLEMAAQAPEKSMAEVKKDVVRQHWRGYTIRDAIWHVRDAWAKVTVNCIRGAWKKLCPDYAVDFQGFSLDSRLSEERLKCLTLAKKVGLDDVEEEDVNELLESINEELTAEDLQELEEQRIELEEQLEAASSEPSTSQVVTKQLTVKNLQELQRRINHALNFAEEIDPNVERSGLFRRKVTALCAPYEQLLYEKRRDSQQSKIERFFPRTPRQSFSEEEPGPSTSTSSINVTPTATPQQQEASSDIDDPESL